MGLRRHRAIRHRELVAGVDLDVARIAGSGAACRDAGTIGQRDRPTGRDIDVAACRLRRSAAHGTCVAAEAGTSVDIDRSTGSGTRTSPRDQPTTVDLHLIRVDRDDPAGS